MRDFNAFDKGKFSKTSYKSKEKSMIAPIKNEIEPKQLSNGAISYRNSVQ